MFFFFFKQKKAYEMRISDWSSDVCSSDLPVIVAQMRDERAAVRTELEPEHQPDAAHAVKQMVVVRDELFERTAKALAGRLDRREEAFLQHDVEHRLSRGAGARVAALGRTMGADHHAPPALQSGVAGMSGAVRGHMGGRRLVNTKIYQEQMYAC